MKEPKHVSALAGYFLNRRGRRAAGQSTKHRPRRASPFRVESLEARVLLSADLAGAVQQTQVVQAAVVEPQQQAASNYVEGAVNIGQAAPDSGYAYSVAQNFGTPGDSGQAPTASTVKIYENGQELGPAHTWHSEIRQQGAGRFSHWGDALWFSASDNSNPLTNGRSYTYRVYADAGSTPPVANPAPSPSASYTEGAVNIGQAAWDSGYAYSVAQNFGTPGDSGQAPTASTVKIYENG